MHDLSIRPLCPQTQNGKFGAFGFDTNTASCDTYFKVFTKINNANYNHTLNCVQLNFL